MSESNRVIWSQEFNASGSNPVIEGETIYIGSADGSLYAFNAKSGAKKWQFQTGEHLLPGPQIISTPNIEDLPDQVIKQKKQGIKRIDMTPSIHSGTLFFGSGDHIFYALDANTGAKKWQYEAGKGMASSNNTMYQVSSPVIINDVVYFVNIDGLHALSIIDGEKIWMFETLRDIPESQIKDMKRSPSAPVFFEGLIYLTAWPLLGRLAPAQSYLYAIDSGTGKAIWTVIIDGVNISEPLVVNNHVCVAVGPKLLVFDMKDGEKIWERSTGKYGSGRILAVNNTVYFSGDKILLAIDVNSGQVVWSKVINESEGDLINDNNNLYLISQKDGFNSTVSTILAVDLTTGTERWSISEKTFLNNMTREGDFLFVSGNSIYKINIGDGKKIWSFNGNGGQQTRPMIHNNVIFTASSRIEYYNTGRVKKGFLYAINL